MEQFIESHWKVGKLMQLVNVSYPKRMCGFFVSLSIYSLSLLSLLLSLSLSSAINAAYFDCSVCVTCVCVCWSVVKLVVSWNIWKSSIKKNTGTLQNHWLNPGLCTASHAFFFKSNLWSTLGYLFLHNQINLLLGVSLNGGTPISHPKCWSFLVGKPNCFWGNPKGTRRWPWVVRLDLSSPIRFQGVQAGRFDTIWWNHVNLVMGTS